MRASGTAGKLKVGYQAAATLGPWSLEFSPGLGVARFSIHAELRRVDDSFWITQTPQVLELRFGRFRWTWRDVNPAFSDGHVSAIVIGKPSIVKE